MSAMDGMPFAPRDNNSGVSEEALKEQRDRRDASVKLAKDGKSNRFIAVRLIDMYAPEWRERFGPVRVVQVIRHRVGVAGNKVEIDCRVIDGHVYFDWNAQIGWHVAWFYDDDEGYNRSILASHFYNEQFEIMEADIRSEIEKMAEKLKETAKPPASSNDTALSEEDIARIGEEGIDEQIAYLKKQKQLLKKNKTKSAKKEENAPPTSNEVPKTEVVNNANTQKSPLVLS